MGLRSLVFLVFFLSAFFLCRAVQDNDAQMVSDIDDVRIIGVIVLTILLGIAVIGMEWEARVRAFFSVKRLAC